MQGGVNEGERRKTKMECWLQFRGCSERIAPPNNRRASKSHTIQDKSVYELSGHPKANAIRFSKRAVTISVQIGSPGCLMVNLAIAFLSAEEAGS